MLINYVMVIIKLDNYNNKIENRGFFLSFLFLHFYFSFLKNIICYKKWNNKINKLINIKIVKYID